MKNNEELSFTKGPLAFEDFTKFTIISAEEDGFPFKMLQSLEEDSLAFVITDPFLFKEDYDFELGEEILQELAIEEPEQIAVYVLLVIPENINQISANLAAPIIINTDKKIAKQVILEGKEYPTKHFLFADQPKKQDQKEAFHANP